MSENGSEDGLLEGVFALGAGDDEAAAQAALEGRVLGELLALRKATGVLTVQKFGRFEALRTPDATRRRPPCPSPRPPTRCWIVSS